jgi:hypothetical protein
MAWYQQKKQTFTRAKLVRFAVLMTALYGSDRVLELLAELMFRVTSTDHAGKNISTILSEEVDLARLIPLKQPVLNGQFAVPINFLILNVEDEFHTTERLYNQFFGRTAKYAGDVFALYTDEDAETQTAMVDSEARVAAANTRLHALRKELAGQLERAEVTRLQTTHRNHVSELEKVSVF